MDALLSLSKIGRRELNLRDVDLSALADGGGKVHFSPGEPC